VATRAGVGITEAAIMTCCTTLIVDYYDGDARNRWLGMQTVGAALAATVFFAIGGALGSLSWRAPFWLYSSAFVFTVLATMLIWQPVKPAAEAHRVIPPFPVKVLLIPVVVTVFGGVVFYAPVVEVSYVLDNVGITSTAAIGVVGAVASLSTAIGGLAFARLTGLSTRRLLTIAFALAGVGLIGFALATPLPLIIVSVLVACAGTGLLLPTLLTWAVSHLSFDERGRGTGLWTASLFMGEFLCPLLVLGLTGLLSGLSAALVAIGAISLLMIVVSQRVVRDV
jgi:MFS family permease